MNGITIPEVAQDLIINIINIVILFLIVRFLVYKPVHRFLTARTERVEREKAEAAEAMKKAEASVGDYQKQLEENRARGEKIISEAERTARENARQIIDHAHEEAKQIISKAQADMATEHNEMITSMQEEIVHLAIEISGKILKREFNDNDNVRLAAEFFSSQDGE